MQKKIQKYLEDTVNSKIIYPLLSLLVALEAIFLHIPAEMFFMPLIALKNKIKYRNLWIVAVLSSVIGAIICYFLGALFFNGIEPFLNHIVPQEKIASTYKLMEEYGWIVVFVGATFILPFKLTVFVAGMYSMSFPVFITTVLIGRGLRFAISIWILSKFQKEFNFIFTKHFKLIILLSLLLLALIFWI
ncbi:MAG: DedA family protein [Alphaproteobacteria bacterium]|nr:DedA family protein [Alphaproteobacteria bacterium]MBL0717877.1 DedA family protein [Alphaproteobacteria bacterium]